MILKMLERLPAGKGIHGKEILRNLKKLGCELKESTLRRHHLRLLKECYDVVNIPSSGGYLIQSSEG